MFSKDLRIFPVSWDRTFCVVRVIIPSIVHTVMSVFHDFYLFSTGCLNEKTVSLECTGKNKVKVLQSHLISVYIKLL